MSSVIILDLVSDQVIKLPSMTIKTIDYKIRNDLSVFVPHVYESVFVEITSVAGTKGECHVTTPEFIG